MHSCLSCGCGYLDPRPSAETLPLAYARYYTHESRVEFTREENRLRALRRGIRADYFASRFDWKDESARWPGRHLALAWPSLADALDTLVARNLPGRGEGRRLLDIGCGNGEYLAFAHRAGWAVQGLDFDPEAVKSARRLGFEVTQGTIESLVAASETFDRITLNHVIEHVGDPTGLLKRCFTLLKPGGELWLETPNVDALGHTVFGRSWRGLEPPRHLLLFSRRALIELLQQAGFQEIRDHFNALGVRLIWNESRALLRRDGTQLGRAHGRLARWRAERAGRGAPARREFITLACRKPAPSTT